MITDGPFSIVNLTLAILAIGLGIGEFLKEFQSVSLRRWGRAFRMCTPISVGIVTTISVIFGTKGFDVENAVWAYVLLLPTMVSILAREDSAKGIGLRPLD